MQSRGLLLDSTTGTVVCLCLCHARGDPVNDCDIYGICLKGSGKNKELASMPYVTTVYSTILLYGRPRLRSDALVSSHRE